LSEAERKLLRVLGIFPASFTLEAATAVMGAVSGTGAAVQGIAGLVEKSLVVLDGTSASARWRLLETTRAYALEKLNESGEAEQASRRHAAFFRDLLTLPAPSLPLQTSIDVREIDNVRAALDWAFSEAGVAPLGIALTAAFVPAWLQLSLFVECRERISQALTHLQAQETPSARPGMLLHVALGLALVYTTGLVSRTEQELTKGLELAEELDDLDNQLVALWALWFYHMTGGELRHAEPLATRFQVVAQRSDDPADRVLGDQIIGNTMHFNGNQPEARRCFDRVLGSPDSPSDPRHSTWILSDVRVPARGMLARVLLLQGLLDRAGRDARSSFEFEQARGRPLSICTVLRYTVCSVAFATDDLETATSAVTLLTDLAERHGSAFWSRIGRCMQGTLLIKRGDLSAGTALLRAALKTVKNRPPDLLAVLAEGLAGLGELPEAIATIEERLERSISTGERWYDPELLRLKGELLVQGETGQPSAAAEACFQDAIDLARHQGALFWELRSAHSLARLRLRQNRPEDALQQLAPVYARFSEGFETTDLRSARRLLDLLSSPHHTR
jgi:predicted ATPase